MKKLQVTLLLLLICSFAFAQQDAPFYKDIQNFKQKDSINPPPKNAILFIGSSSFTKWTDVQDYFPGYTIVNRGFGGSTLPDVIRYVNDVVYAYDPKQVVIYCGENDAASSDTVTSKIIFERFKKLYGLIRDKYPAIQISFVSMKPSPSRTKFFPKIIAANKMIKDFIRKQKNAAFINVYDAMLGKDGQPMPDIFIEDNLHMNAKGYAIWQKIIEPYLVK